MDLEKKIAAEILLLRERKNAQKSFLESALSDSIKNAKLKDPLKKKTIRLVKRILRSSCVYACVYDRWKKNRQTKRVIA